MERYKSIKWKSHVFSVHFLSFLDSSISPNYTLLEKDPVLSGDNVLDAKTEILGSREEFEDVYVKFGDMINLTCVISDVPAPPKHVFWYHDEKVTKYYTMFENRIKSLIQLCERSELRSHLTGKFISFNF